MAHRPAAHRYTGHRGRDEGWVHRAGKDGRRHGGELLQSGHEVTRTTVAGQGRSAAEQGAKPARSFAETREGDVVITPRPTTPPSKRSRSATMGSLRSPRPAVSRLFEHDQRRAVDGRRPRTPTQASSSSRHRCSVDPKRPQAAKLFVVAAGAAATLQPPSPAFDAIGQRTFVASQDLKAANLGQLSGNLIASVIELLGEAWPWSARPASTRTTTSRSSTSTLLVPGGQDLRRPHRAEESSPPVRRRARRQGRPARIAAGRGRCSRHYRSPAFLRDRFLDTAGQRGRDLDWSAVGALSAGRPAGRARRLEIRRGAGRLRSATWSSLRRRSASMRLARSWARVVLRRGIFRPRLGSALGAFAGALTGAVGLHSVEKISRLPGVGGVGSPARRGPDDRAVG